MPVTSALLSAAPAMMQQGAGLAQSVIGFVGAHNAQKQLENTPTPFYQPNKGIQDYYQEALNRYTTSPYTSQMYQQAQINAANRMATGINALQDRRLGIQGITALEGQNQNSLNQSLVAAEQQRNRNFQTLGQAANMQAGDQRMQFQYNQLLPYERRMSILGAKAAGYNRMLSAGMQNIFGGAAGASQIGSSMAQQGLFNGSSPTGNNMSYADAYDVPLAQTGGGAGISPAAGITSINPNMALPLIGG